MRTGGLEEGRIGAGESTGSYSFRWLGTGIAGEIGHIVVRPDGPPCDCGQRGCLERLPSASAVGQAWAAASGDPRADAAACAKAVEARDERAQTVWLSAVDALAHGLVTALTLLDPRTIIVGGGLAEAGETMFAPLRAAVERRITFQTPPSLVPAALGDTAAARGAGLLAWDMVAANTPAPGTS